MKIRRNAFRPYVALAALLTLAGAVLGQRTDSVIVGTVTDATGAAVPSAKIVATNVDTNVKYNSFSNSSGEYRINDVPSGTYAVSAAASGFGLAEIAGVQA